MLLLRLYWRGGNGCPLLLVVPSSTFLLAPVCGLPTVSVFGLSHVYHLGTDAKHLLSAYSPGFSILSVGHIAQECSDHSLLGKMAGQLVSSLPQVAAASVSYISQFMLPPPPSFSSTLLL